MHLFEDISSDGRILMCTDDPICIPIDNLATLVKLGHKFKVNGKITSRAAIIAEFSSYAKPSAERTEVTSSRSVRCIDTGDIFSSQSEAAKFFHIDPAQVSDSIKTGRPRSGHTFERYNNED